MNEKNISRNKSKYAERGYMKMGLTVGIDYDNTITSDRAAFTKIIEIFHSFGHKVIIVTGRKKDQPIDDIFKNLVHGVVYCSNEYKSVEASRAGFKIDIWIDDEPGHIEPQRKLKWE